MSKLEIIKDEDLFEWYARSEIPLIKISRYFGSSSFGVINAGRVKGYGHINDWLEKNIESPAYLLISSGYYVIVLTNKEDFIAFKIRFPEYC